MKLSNRAYNALKFVALVLLPGFSAAYFSLAQIWGLPNSEQVVGTATVLDTLLGLLLKASTTVYDKTENAPDGDLVVSQVDGELYASLAGPRDGLAQMAAKDEIRLKVVVRPEETSTPASE